MAQPRFTADWFTNAAWAWEQYLPPFFDERPVKWLEVGSYEGRSALWVADHILPPASTVTCVDHFDADYEMLFDSNTKNDPRILKARGKSRDVLPTLVPGFGGAYVDGSHEEEEVAHDARAVWSLLSPGAPIIFDDYGMVPVRAAVDQFIREVSRTAAVVFNGYQLILRKVR